MTDANTSDGSEQLEVAINWGDGTPSSPGGANPVGPGAPGEFGIGGSHTYDARGSFTVTATVTSILSGATITFTSTVNVD
jgi:hypothetical protein